MIAKSVSIAEAQATFEELIAAVRLGQEVVLKDGDIVVARLVPEPIRAGKRVAGLHAGTAWTSSDFDDDISLPHNLGTT